MSPRPLALTSPGPPGRRTAATMPLATSYWCPCTAVSSPGGGALLPAASIIISSSLESIVVLLPRLTYKTTRGHKSDTAFLSNQLLAFPDKGIHQIFAPSTADHQILAGLFDNTDHHGDITPREDIADIPSGPWECGLELEDAQLWSWRHSSYFGGREIRT